MKLEYAHVVKLAAGVAKEDRKGGIGEKVVGHRLETRETWRGCGRKARAEEEREKCVGSQIGKGLRVKDRAVNLSWICRQSTTHLQGQQEREGEISRANPGDAFVW